MKKRMRFSCRLLVCLATMLLGASSAFSQTPVEFPLTGYFRVGRFMPVMLTGPTETVSFTGDGVLPTIIETGSPQSRIVLVLITDSHIQMRNTTQSFHLLGDRDRLIGSTFNQSHLPNDIVIPLDAIDPLPGPAIAWENFDLIETTVVSMSRINSETIAVLLSAGCAFQAVGENPPDTRWPWKKENDRWTLHLEPSGPSDSIVNEAAFSPTLSWAPGKSVVFRKQIFIAAISLSIVIVALLLWRSKVSVIVILFAILLFSVAITIWQKSLPPVNQINGSISVEQNSLHQTDHWFYERGVKTGSRSIPWNGSTHPVFFSRAQIAESKMQLRVGATGQMSFAYQSSRDKTIGFLHRRIEADQTPRPVSNSRSSPMQELAKQEYLRAGTRIVGEMVSPGEPWPTVVIRPSER